MDNWHIVYNTATGASVSIGSVLADPMPSEFSVFDMTEAEKDQLFAGTLRWDEATRSLVANDQ